VTDQAQALPLPRTLRPSRTALVAGGCALAGAAVVLVALALLTGGHGAAAKPAVPRYTAPGSAFSVVLPAGWRALTPRQVAAVPSRPIAVLRRADHRGLVLVNEIAPLDGSLKSVTRSLTKRLRGRFAGFRPNGARLVTLRSGTAYLYTFVRGNVVQSITVASTNGHTYAIDSVLPGDAPDVARQVGRIVLSFG
jgi:hypothetical protein